MNDNPKTDKVRKDLEILAALQDTSRLIYWIKTTGENRDQLYFPYGMNENFVNNLHKRILEICWRWDE